MLKKPTRNQPPNVARAGFSTMDRSHEHDRPDLHSDPTE